MAASPVLLGAIADKSVADRVAQEVRRAIFESTLAPGRTLTELEVARDLQVSQATVRSAFAMLEGQGLLVRDRERRRTFVFNFDKKTLEQRVAVRMELEGMALEEFAQKYQEADRKTREEMGQGLEEKLVQMRKADQMARGLEQKPVQTNAAAKIGAGEADFEFHKLVWEGSENRYLSDLLIRETRPLFAAVRLLIDADLKEGTQVDCHALLRDALIKNERQLIRDALKNHMERAYQLFLESSFESFSDVWSYVEACRVSRSKRDGSS